MTDDEWLERVGKIFTIVFPGHMTWGRDVVELGSSLKVRCKLLVEGCWFPSAASVLIMGCWVRGG